MPSQVTDIVNLGPTPVRVKYYEGAGENRVGDTLLIPAAGLQHGSYPEVVLASTHFKSLSEGPLKVLKKRVRVIP